MMATVSPEIEPNCIPTACSITQGNGACLINNKKNVQTQHTIPVILGAAAKVSLSV